MILVNISYGNSLPNFALLSALKVLRIHFYRRRIKTLLGSHIRDLFLKFLFFNSNQMFLSFPYCSLYGGIFVGIFIAGVVHILY